MTLKTTSGVAALALSIAVLGAPAGAVVMEATFTGQITSGSDMTGIFGTIGGDLAGLGYVLTFTYDTSLGTRTTQDGSDVLGGGTASGSVSPVSALLTVNGTDFAFPGAYNGVVSITRNGPAGVSTDNVLGYTVQDDMADSVHTMDDSVTVLGFSAIAPDDLTVPFSVTTSDFYVPSNYNNSFLIYDYSYVTHSYSEYTKGSLSVDTLQVREVGAPVPSPVPLPATAVLLASGLFGMGALGRRCRRAA